LPSSPAAWISFSFGGDGQVDVKGQAFARFAFNEDFPLMGLDGLPHEKQFQPGFFPAGTPQAEGMKNGVARIFIQAGAVVVNGQADGRAGNFRA
jgi:hypothetical protein